MTGGAKREQPRRLLIATHYLLRIAGSEVVAYETARHFAAAGCKVSVFANAANGPMAAMIEAVTGAPVITDPDRIRPFTYDMVYVQHQVLGLFDYRVSADDRAMTRMVAGRLSRWSYLESGGWLHDRLLLDHVLANSELTAEHLATIGHGTPTTIFYNAAPAAFFRPFVAKPTTPRRILWISNHRDPALAEAVDRLRQSIVVDHVGEQGGQVTLVTPEMIAAADAVVSIGKSVPYALAAHVPVYIYDHLGGPGYLDADTVGQAARFNFSGRCCERKLTGEALAAEIVGDYAKGVAFARDTPAAWLERYRQPRYMDLLLDAPLATNAEKRRRLLDSPFVMQERMLAAHVREDLRTRQRLLQQIGALDARLKALGAAGGPAAE